MASSRLPGKILLDLGRGNNSIDLMLSRIQKCESDFDKLIATSADQSDDVLCSYIANKKLELTIYRGDVYDVLSRFAEALAGRDYSYVVRLTADCPFIDPQLIDKCITTYLDNDATYVCNNYPPTYPDGLDVEVFSTKALLEANELAVSNYDREHVTPYIRRKYANSMITVRNDALGLEDLRLTLDYKEDLIFLRRVFSEAQFDRDVCWRAIVQIARKYRGSKNSRFKRNEGSEMQESKKLWLRAEASIPGGNSFFSKRPSLHLPEKWPTYFKSAVGCDITDLWGNTYKDFGYMGVGTNVVGYAHPEINSAVKECIDNSNMSTLNCFEEVLLAEKLIDLHPWAHQARFARTGAEANAIAVRLARAATGRNEVAVCGYHGWHDWYLAANLQSGALDDHLLKGLQINGVSAGLQDSVLPFKYGDLDSFLKIISSVNLAAVIMEVGRSTAPDIRFLSTIRKKCSERGIVLIFDECSSGFRSNLGGMHLELGIDPDLVMYGKALGNGFAITTVLGTEEVMEFANTSFMSSTFWSERIGFVAALATLEVMQKHKIFEVVKNIDQRLRASFKTHIDLMGEEARLGGILGLPSFNFSKQNDVKKTLITQEMLKRGYLASNVCYVSYAHSEFVDQFLINIGEVFEMLVENESDPERLISLLEVKVCQTGFARLS